MKKEYEDIIKKRFPFEDGDLNKLLGIITIRNVPAGTILLREGEIASILHLVIKGCLRTYFVKDTGAEVTSQFFIESQVVASFESAVTRTPGNQYIEAIEDSTIAFIPMEELEKLFMNNATAIAGFNRFIMNRLIYYMNQHASFILDSPEQRYLKLLKEFPGLASRLPQQYIASFLGITPVSLSRIRARLKRSGVLLQK
ncbi:MAG: Crp/Fnr family transcriptional regulator [Spirochaetes bacterium]|nr:Crp/Fnr family transcriptional regulator [Spirochaetota bacterium]